MIAFNNKALLLLLLLLVLLFIATEPCRGDGDTLLADGTEDEEEAKLRAKQPVYSQASEHMHKNMKHDDLDSQQRHEDEDDSFTEFMEKRHKERIMREYGAQQHRQLYREGAKRIAVDAAVENDIIEKRKKRNKKNEGDNSGGDEYKRSSSQHRSASDHLEKEVDVAEFIRGRHMNNIDKGGSGVKHADEEHVQGLAQKDPMVILNNPEKADSDEKESSATNPNDETKDPSDAMESPKEGEVDTTSTAKFGAKGGKENSKPACPEGGTLDESRTLPRYLMCHHGGSDVISSWFVKDGFWKDCLSLPTIANRAHTMYMRHIELQGGASSVGSSFLSDVPVVLDVGGNIGTCALLMASRGANVTVFEPLVDNFRMMSASVKLPGNEYLRSRMKLFKLAAGDEHGEKKIHVQDGNYGNSIVVGHMGSRRDIAEAISIKNNVRSDNAFISNSGYRDRHGSDGAQSPAEQNLPREDIALGMRHGHDANERIKAFAEAEIRQKYVKSQLSAARKRKIQITKLDDEIQRHVNLLKLDCQGSEMKAVQGAQDLFQRYGVDAIRMEWDSRLLRVVGSDPVEFLRLLWSYDFVLFDEGHDFMVMDSLWNDDQIEEFVNRTMFHATEVIALHNRIIATTNETLRRDPSIVTMLHKNLRHVKQRERHDADIDSEKALASSHSLLTAPPVLEMKRGGTAKKETHTLRDVGLYFKGTLFEGYVDGKYVADTRYSAKFSLQ